MGSHQYEQIIDASRDFITLIDRDYRYAFANEAYTKELGISADDILGKTVAEVWGAEKFRKRIMHRLDDCFNGVEGHDIDEFKFGTSNKYIHVAYYPYYEGDEITHAVVYSHDVSIVKKLESKLLDFEFKDPVTGLFNRKSFNIVLDMELEKARRSSADGIRAVIFVSLRNISQINASFGYELGDLLIESTALRIKEALRASDYVFRFDGKEMAVILTTIKRGIDLPSVAENIRAKVDFPYSHKGTTISIVCNMGAAIFPDDGESRDEIVQNAMSAMNVADTRNERLVMFNKTLNERGLYLARLRSDIRTAFVEQQFTTYFQPIVEPDGTIAGAEALIRWQHPVLGAIPPSEFIPVAEESRSIAMIGRWILFQVCRYIRQWDDVLGDRYVSINLSSSEFNSPTLVQELQEILSAEGVRPSSLKLEITESQSMDNLDAVVMKIRSLSRIGIDVLIDDFGSGYSSLGYLKRLPAKTIKVDKSFVDRIVDEKEDRDFIKGIITMIGSKNRHVLVEGVANRSQYTILRDLGIKYMQGFYFSRPRTADDFYRLLRDGVTLPKSE
ncbi:MAG: EAL domain-containing protein [Spirochaetales bacterium]|nr:EAL domain-containing protein [Spirochaetales bacterium]